MEQDRATVVVIDDEYAWVGALVGLLSDQFHVITAADGDAGLKAIREHRPKLVLLDHMLPGATGLQVLQEIRQDPALAKTQVVMVTAASIESAGERAPWDALVNKPLRMKELIEIMNQLLQRP